MALATHCTFFETSLGTCALAWSATGLTHAWLPGADSAALRRTVARRCPEASDVRPEGQWAERVDAIVALLAGSPVDLTAVPLDESGIDAFDRRVYAVTRTIPPGRVLTYGDVAAAVGGDASARAVGQSLGRNRMPIVVPCHRVVASGNGLGGFSAPGGTSTKRRLLAIENARRAGPPGLFDAAEPARR